MVYEYRTDRFTGRGPALDMNAMGLDGWRLVCVVPTTMTGDLLAFFEREVVLPDAAPSAA